MTDNIEQKDPELRDDRDLPEAEDLPEVELPEFDESDFVLPEDYEDGDDD